MIRHLQLAVAVTLLSGCVAANSPAPVTQAPVSAAAAPRQEVPLVTARAGERVPLGPVYWVSPAFGCQSQLRRVDSVTLVLGTEHVTLTLLPQRVRTFQCGNEVDGAVVEATVLRLPGPDPVLVEYRVSYDTHVGPQASFHRRLLQAAP